jgi:hypothetical protein
MNLVGHLMFWNDLPLVFWIWLWKIVLIGSLALFGCMAVWVTIGGYIDVKRLFKTISESHREEL